MLVSCHLQTVWGFLLLSWSVFFLFLFLLWEPSLFYIYYFNRADNGVCMCAFLLSCFSHVWLCVALCPWGFSRQECWSGLPCPPPGDLPNAGINPCLLCLLHWQVGSLQLVLPGKPQVMAGRANKVMIIGWEVCKQKLMATSDHCLFLLNFWKSSTVIFFYSYMSFRQKSDLLWPEPWSSWHRWRESLFWPSSEPVCSSHSVEVALIPIDWSAEV